MTLTHPPDVDVDETGDRPEPASSHASAEPATGRSPTNQSPLVLTVVLALVAILIAVVAFAVAARAVDEAQGDGGADGGAAAAPATVSVELTELAITPSEIRVAAGGSIEVHNAGAIAHDFAVEGTDLHTPMLNAGESATLRLGDLAPGVYDLLCHVPGHAAGGMTGTLTVVAADGVAAGGDTVAGGHGGHGDMSWEEMDRLMRERTLAFPAATEGVGGRILEPTIAPDGAKVFELTASIIEWEVEPGKVVEGWAYNGQIPGPTMRAKSGDLLRFVLKNELPESTAIHFHGLHTPNSMDGVPDITQPPVKPGETFVYEFVADGPAVGMYHSHHNAAHQVPNGLAGALLVDQVPVPAGVPISQEIPMMLNDAGTIGLSLNGKSFPATAPVVVKQGERILVHYLNEGLTEHPMHLHGQDQLVVAKDGFPLAQPYLADTINVAPGERYSVVITADEPGTWAWHCHILTHAERSDGMFGMVTALIVD